MSPTERQIALLSCTKSKTGFPAPARVLYSESALFRKALAYVEPSADEVYVLSALYGLVALDQSLEPYELTLKTMSRLERRAWADRVMQQITTIYGPDLRGITCAFHTGTEYREELTSLLERAGAVCTCPVEGLAIGERLQFYGGGRQGPGKKVEPQPPAPPQDRIRVEAPPAEPRASRVTPSTGFGVIWSRIVAHAGEPFYQVRGGEFRYHVAGQALRFDRTNMPLPYAHLEEAHRQVPLPNTSVVQHLRAPSYIYAILMDKRIRQADW